MSADARADCERLHALACELTGREERFAFHAEPWARLLQLCDYDAARVEAELRLLVRYLRGRITAGARNPGALKLRNLLALDRWDEDIAEARALARRRAAVVAPAEERPVLSLDEEEALRQRAREIAAETRRQLGGPAQ